MFPGRRREDKVCWK